VKRARGILGAATLAHFIHDGFSDVLYLLLPIWAGALGLTYTQVGFLKTVYNAGMAVFQVPAGLLAERWGERWLLAAGTAVTALAFVGAGAAGGFAALAGCLLVGGLGSGVQHPLSSSLVSRAYESGRRRLALGTYNFSGDVGKTAVPAGVAFLLPALGWRGATWAYAGTGLVAAAGLLTWLGALGAGSPQPAAPRAEARPAGRGGRLRGWGIRNVRGYCALSAVYVLDNATRAAFFTFLPFLLIRKGGTTSTVGLALALLFAGGAVGKLACGALSERVGMLPAVITTEVATGVGILALLPLPLPAILVVLPVLGMVVNGTSSVLYGTVAELVDPDRQARSYGIFYTLGVTASATAPVLWGVVSDWRGVPATLTVVGCLVFLAVPLALLLRPALRPTPAAR
jgi:FSR family fosmidomycin resistance protein-like MFS transporter